MLADGRWTPTGRFGRCGGLRLKAHSVGATGGKMNTVKGSGLRVDRRRIADVARRFRDRTSGSTASEYALLLGLLVMVLVISISMFGGAVSSLFSSYPQLISS
jgi:Flp pilus assembly pilin Flp